MKRKHPEHDFQVEVLDYLTAFGRRDLYWFAVPNGELRHVNVALRLKAQGVKRGIPDICILLDGGQTAWLELKARRGTASDEQIGFGMRCERLGHLWGCCKTMEQVVEVLTYWNVLRTHREAA